MPRLGDCHSPSLSLLRPFLSVPMEATNARSELQAGCRSASALKGLVPGDQGTFAIEAKTVIAGWAESPKHTAWVRLGDWILERLSQHADSSYPKTSMPAFVCAQNQDRDSSRDGSALRPVQSLVLRSGSCGLSLVRLGEYKAKILFAFCSP